MTDQWLLDSLIESYSVAAQKNNVKSDCITLPLVYSHSYNIGFGGIQRLHPFDTKKWLKVFQSLSIWVDSNNKILQVYEPFGCVTDDDLLLVHCRKFMESLRKQRTIVNTTEVCLLYLFPHCLAEKFLLQPLRCQTSGTILATYLAAKYQTAINIGGGFHHCSSNQSGGFCFFADITLAVKKLWHYCNIQQIAPKCILIVDCDAHQGNGYARDVLQMTSSQQKLIYILDLYNPRIYPKDEYAKQIINREILLPRLIEDDEYLRLLNYHLNATFELDRFKPEFIIFNAGTDILADDKLGRLMVSANGIIKRDEIVFRFAQHHNAPILMLLSGGYQSNNFRVIADSIINLIDLNLLKVI